MANTSQWRNNDAFFDNDIIIAFYKRDKEIAYQLYPTYTAAGRPNKVSLVWPRWNSSEGELIRDRQSWARDQHEMDRGLGENLSQFI